MATHRSGRSGAANSTAETPYMPNRALSFRIITYRPARSLAAQRSCRPRTRMAPSSAYIPASARFRAATIRVVGAQISQIAAALSLVRPAWSAGIGSLWSRSSVCEAPMSRTLAPPKEGRGPWCELDRGPTLKQLSGPYRRMEVITMTVVAILIAIGVVALVYVGLFFVVLGFFFAMFALDTTEAAPWRGVHSRHR